MSTSSSTTAFSFDNGKYTKTTTTITSRKNSNGEWVEHERTVVIEEMDQPFLLGPTVPQQPVPPTFPSYPTFPATPYPQYPGVIYCSTGPQNFG